MTATNVGRRGSVRQAENGTWFLIVDVGEGIDRRQTRRRGFATRKAAQAELTRILGTLEQRTYVVPKRQILSAFLTDVWLPAIEHTVKPRIVQEGWGAPTSPSRWTCTPTSTSTCRPPPRGKSRPSSQARRQLLPKSHDHSVTTRANPDRWRRSRKRSDLRERR